MNSSLTPDSGRAGSSGRGKRPLVAATLSALVPGVGQIYAGHRRRGLALVVISLLAGSAAVAMLIANPTRVLKLAFEPKVLMVLLALDVMLLAFRGFAVVDAYRMAQSPHAPSRRVLWSVAPVLAFVLLAPHTMFAYYDLVQYDLINTVFTAPDPVAAVTTTFPPDPSQSAVATPATSPAVPSSTSTSATSTTAAPTTTVPTTTAPPLLWVGLERLNILLLGSDAGVGRTGVRTDTMILVSIDPDNGDMALMSFPRNFIQVPLPVDVDIWQCDCFPLILNELYQYGEDNPASFLGSSTPGANAIKGAVGEMVGLPVHFYALVALEGFVDVVDALGGVTVIVNERVYDPAYPKEEGGTEVVDIQPGVYDFDGHDALAYARTRYSSDDYSRIGRQRCVIEALFDQADPFSLLRGYPQLAEVIKDTVETDIPLNAVPDLIDLVTKVDTQQAVSLRFVPPVYISGRTADGYNIPDVELISEHAEIVTTLSPEEAMRQLGIDPLADACS